MPHEPRCFKQPDPFTRRDSDLRHLGEIAEETMERLRREQANPLVRIEERLADGRVAVVLTDPEMAGFEYDFYVHNSADAVHWIAHLAEKRWVKKRRLELFAVLMDQVFNEGART